MNHKMQSTCGAGILRRGRAVLVIAAAAGLVSGVGAAGGGDSSEKKAIVLDAEAILNRWEPVAKAAGAAPYWREQYATQLRQLPDYLVEQIAALEPLPDDALASYRRFGQAFVNAYANLVLNPRAEDKARNKLGSTTNDQVFIPIAPCRVVDTRNAGGPISNNTARNFFFYSQSSSFSWSTQGGAGGTALSACPGTLVTSQGGTLGNVAPSAAVATVTVVNATAAGNWLVWGGAGDPAGVTSSTLNWSAGQVLANTTVIPSGGRTGTGLGGTVRDFAIKYDGPSGQADVIVDVVGYFVQNRATALQCVYLTASGSGTVTNGNYVIVDTPFCTTGYTKTGTGCYHQSSGIPLTVTSPDFFNRCTWVNTTGGSVSATLYRAQTVCCRVPGQ
jgi:hypothetical protein